MKTSTPAALFRRMSRPLFWVFAACILFSSHRLAAQSLETTLAIDADGSVAIDVRMSFDAATWPQWKSSVGDQPARVRALMRHHLGAHFLIEDFKLEKDDLNRTAHIAIRSPVGPVFTSDGKLGIPLEKELRLVTNSERTWFFSGNLAAAGGTLSTVKIVLPSTLAEAVLRDAGDPKQALVYSLRTPAGRLSRGFFWTGAALLVAGGGLAGIDFGPPRRRPARRRPRTNP